MVCLTISWTIGITGLMFITIFYVKEAEKGYGNTVKNLLIWFVRTNDAMMIDNFVKISEQSKVSEAVFQRCSYEKVF